MNFFIEFYQSGLEISDIDGDNKPDLTISSANGLSVLRNTSTSGIFSFAPLVIFRTGRFTLENVSIIDLDGDIKPDFAVVDGSNDVGVFRNLRSEVVSASATDTNVCYGKGVTLSGSGADTYTWTGGVINGVEFIPSVGSSTFIVKGTDTTTGCTNLTSILINVHPLPIINAGLDKIICNGQTVTLNATGSSNYSWNNNVTNNNAFSPTATKTYTVTGTDANGCQNTDDVLVNVNPLPIINAGLDKIICYGQSVTLNASGASAYIWNNNVLNNISFSPVNTKSYIVDGTDINGCNNRDTVLVVVNPINNSQFTKIVNNSYIWNNQTYSKSGVYTSVFKNKYGCDSTVILNLTINKLGLDEVSNPIIKFYPNPANYNINIDYDGQIEKIEILDLKGAIVYTTNEHKHELILPQNIKSGFYTVVIQTAEGIFRKELMIER